jgi:hypothetical protein
MKILKVVRMARKLKKKGVWPEGLSMEVKMVSAIAAVMTEERDRFGLEMIGAASDTGLAIIGRESHMETVLDLAGEPPAPAA